MYLSPQSFLSVFYGTKSRKKKKKRKLEKKAQDNNLERAIKEEQEVRMEPVILVANYFLSFRIPTCKEQFTVHKHD